MNKCMKMQAFELGNLGVLVLSFPVQSHLRGLSKERATAGPNIVGRAGWEVLQRADLLDCRGAEGDGYFLFAAC